MTDHASCINKTKTCYEITGTTNYNYNYNLQPATCNCQTAKLEDTTIFAHVSQCRAELLVPCESYHALYALPMLAIR